MNVFAERRAGILLHPTSLPSGFLNEDVERWLNTLTESSCSVWQVLPLGQPMNYLSPYQCLSAFAMNPALIQDYGDIDYRDRDFLRYCMGEHWLDDYLMYCLLREKFDHAPWFE